MLLGMAENVNPIAAVRVKLSSGHSPSQAVALTGDGVVDFSKVALGVGVAVSANTAGPQETKINRIRLTGKNRKIPGNFIFIAPYLSNKFSCRCITIILNSPSPIRHVLCDVEWGRPAGMLHDGRAPH